MEQQRIYDGKEEITSEGERCVSKEILIKEFEECCEIWNMLNNKFWI
jgi:hypothetical protein